ncbi:MAG: chromosome partitioning protein [Candidatus Omnitrophica bacterium CG11_big_fil_rev_8_21_14_0_20_63_9]|nr:MAG: chromosome partitioning protein [Candidatus Omnitrophica bacterium CG11_big_fil_rev_8_21_14_0_20_63_9]
MTVTSEHILKALRAVQDPDLKRDIVSLGFIKHLTIEGGKVAFQIELTTPACPVKDLLREEARTAVAAIPGVTSVEIGMTSQVRSSVALPPTMGPLAIKNIVPIASGKGGVGKSTVSANLALALARSGARVGLMDADVYGPSIPTILGIPHQQPEVDAQNRISPIEQYGIKVVSMGFFMKPEEAVIWRGPMLHKTVQQFLGGVLWGELDYLLVDLPPGTGDVQLSLCQTIPITGAVIVSTPQDVALNVAQKAVAMFKKLNAPILGVIENMSYYVCAHCGTREDIFGTGGARQIAQRLELPFLGEIPLATPIRVASDAGKPVILTEPASPGAQAFVKAAEQLAAQVSIRALQSETVKVTF